MKRLHLAALALLGLSAVFPASALAQSAVPNLMSYQSRVADAAGVPLGNTTPVNRIVLFRIYDSPNLSAPANRLYSEQQTVTIAGGEFSVLIGSGTAIATESTNAFSTLSAAVFGGATRYLGVTVDDGDGNPFNDPEMSPRQQIVGTPFAFRAQTAESVALGGVSAASLANNSVTTAAIAPSAVGTAQVADAAVTPDKLAANSIDSSKIVDGSLAIADFSPAALAAFSPKPKYVYNQGLAPFVKNTSFANHQYTVFPIDVSDLGVDGDVLVSYYGIARTGTASAYIPSVFSGRLRIILFNFTGGASGITGSPTVTGFTFSNGGATGVPADTSTPFLARHEGGNSECTYTVGGVFNGSNTVTLVTPPTTALPDFPVTGFFPRYATTIQYTYQYTQQSSGTGFTRTAADWGTSFFASGTYFGASGGGALPIGHQTAYAVLTDSTPVPAGTVAFYTGTKTLSYIPLINIFHYYPGTLTATPAAQVPTSLDQANVSTNANAGGAPQIFSVSSVVTGTNKVTITVSNPHVMQVGDTVVIAGMTGTPSANQTTVVTAVPDRTSFEIALTGAAGSYSGGTVTHTPKYYKYRLWVAVHASVAARVIVSDN